MTDKPPVDYISNFVDGPDIVHSALALELAWERRSDAPRDEYYCNDTNEPYAYGRGAGLRTYNVRPWHPAILNIRYALEDLTGALLDVCFLNRYHHSRDWLGWHSDDSPEMDPNRPIVTVSLGAERDIQFRRIGSKGAENTNTLKLENGSCAIMLPGMQQEWEHRIPKVGHDVGSRISLTFRGYKS